MAKKAKRRPFRRPNPQQRNEEAAYRQRNIESAARDLLVNYSPEQLRLELSDRELRLADADRAAQMDPNPINLARYRYAFSEAEAARMALRLVAREA